MKNTLVTILIYLLIFQEFEKKVEERLVARPSFPLLFATIHQIANELNTTRFLEDMAIPKNFLLCINGARSGWLDWSLLEQGVGY